MSDDFFAELEAEVSTSLAKSNLRASRDEAKRKANNIRLSASARRHAAEEHRALTALIEAEDWLSVEIIALFTQQACDGCGSSHRIFLQYMEKKIKKRKPSEQRWNRTSRPEAALPRSVYIQHTQTHICADCCEDHGFNLSDASMLAGPNDPFSVSPSYLQEDINDLPN